MPSHKPLSIEIKKGVIVSAFNRLHQYTKDMNQCLSDILVGFFLQRDKEIGFTPIERGL